MFEFFIHNLTYYILFYLLFSILFLYFNNKQIIAKYKVMFISFLYIILSIFSLVFFNFKTIDNNKLQSIYLLDYNINYKYKEMNTTYIEYPILKRIEYFKYLNESEKKYLKSYFDYIYQDDNITYIEYYNMLSRLFHYTDKFFIEEYVKDVK